MLLFVISKLFIFSNIPFGLVTKIVVHFYADFTF
jgi:hypothetical protein